MFAVRSQWARERIARAERRPHGPGVRPIGLWCSRHVQRLSPIRATRTWRAAVDPTTSAFHLDPGAFFAQKRHIRLACDHCKPSRLSSYPGILRFRWPGYRFETRWPHRRSFPVADEPLHCTARAGCTIRCTSCMFTGHTCYLPAPGAAGFSPSRNLAAGGGSRRLAGARAGVRPPARSRPFLALAAVVSRHACAVSHIPCTPTLPLVVRPSLLNPPCGLQVAVVVVVSPTRCPARGGMSAMGGRGKLCAAAVAGMTSCRALLLRSRCLEEDT